MLAALCQESGPEDLLLLCSSVISIARSEFQMKVTEKLFIDNNYLFKIYNFIKLFIEKILKRTLHILLLFLTLFVACWFNLVQSAGPFIPLLLHLSFNLTVYSVTHPLCLMATHKLTVLCL